MTERHILFSAPMIRALLDGSKTQTRRMVKDTGLYAIDTSIHGEEVAQRELARLATSSPYGQPGDRLWVRESFRVARGYDKLSPLGLISLIGAGEIGIHYEFSGSAPATAGKLRPGIHMPRSFSRILLEVAAVRVERLQDISEVDARAEGITDGGCLNCGNPEPCSCSQPAPDARDAYCNLWRQINGPDSWDLNPFVWVIEFKVVQP